MIKIRKHKLNEDDATVKSPVETPEQTAAKERLEKVNKILEQLKNVYWAISQNIPEEIKKTLPEFKTGNKEAEKAINAWDEFKKNPAESTYNKFVEEFKNYGIASSQTEAQVSESAVSVQQQVESLSSSFGDKLNKKLQEKTKQSYYNNVLETGYFTTQMKF